jgi:hypothetical protein
VVRAVAIEEGLADGCDSPLDADTYPEAYTLARTDYGAPLPEYYTTADAIAEWDAVLDVISEVTFDDLDSDAIATKTTATGDEVGGDAVRAMDPAWRQSESGESVLVFETGTVWDADTERVIDALRLVALDSGLLSDPTEQLAGDLAELIAGALDAVADGEEGAVGRVRAAATALRGGEEGCRTLAAWAPPAPPRATAEGDPPDRPG